MIVLKTENIYRFCSTCRIRMVERYNDGDVEAFACPVGHESLLKYETIMSLRNYALRLFSPGIGVREADGD
jgi:hypothetical protein